MEAEKRRLTPTPVAQPTASKNVGWYFSAKLAACADGLLIRGQRGIGGLRIGLRPLGVLGEVRAQLGEVAGGVNVLFFGVTHHLIDLILELRAPFGVFSVCRAPTVPRLGASKSFIFNYFVNTYLSQVTP